MCVLGSGYVQRTRAPSVVLWPTQAVKPLGVAQISYQYASWELMTFE